MPETTALGAAMAAGAAEGVGVWSLNPEDFTDVTSEKFEPQINPEGKIASAMITALTIQLFIISIHLWWFILLVITSDFSVC